MLQLVGHEGHQGGDDQGQGRQQKGGQLHPSRRGCSHRLATISDWRSAVIICSKQLLEVEQPNSSTRTCQAAESYAHNLTQPTKRHTTVYLSSLHDFTFSSPFMRKCL